MVHRIRDAGCKWYTGSMMLGISGTQDQRCWLKDVMQGSRFKVQGPGVFIFSEKDMFPDYIHFGSRLS